MKQYLVFGLGLFALTLGCVASQLLPPPKQMTNTGRAFEVVVIPNVTHGVFPSGIAVGSFSGGRLPDIATSTWGDFIRGTSGISDGSVAILLGQNKQQRRFARLEEFSAGRGAGSLAAADFNRDGKLDLAVAAMNGQSGLDYKNVEQQSQMDLGKIKIFYGNGDGTFKSGLSIPSPVPFPKSIVVGDLNGDGYPDIVVGTQSEKAKSIGVIFSGPNGEFRTISVPVGGTSSRSVALGHFRDRRYLDIIVANGGGEAGPSLSVLLNDGTGRFTYRQISLASHVWSVAVGDFNNDLIDDLVVHAKEALLIYVGDGQGNFTLHKEITGEFVDSYVRVADLDKDGNLDVIVPTTRLTYSVLFGDGKGGFEDRIDLRAQFRPATLQQGEFKQFSQLRSITKDSLDLSLTTPPTTPEVADVDGDGYPDIVIPATASSFLDRYYQLPISPLERSDAPGFLVIFLNRSR